MAKNLGTCTMCVKRKATIQLPTNAYTGKPVGFLCRKCYEKLQRG